MARRRSEPLYARVPSSNCKGLCRTSCTGGIPTTPEEKRRLRARGVTLLPLAEGDSGEPCPALTILGQCSVYEDRPLICRLWGTAENMPCPHGCVPDGGFMPRAEAAALVHAAGEAD